MSETTETEGTDEPDQHNREREDPSLAGKPEVTAMDGAAESDVPTGRSEEREERQHAMQQHGDTFAVDDEPTDAHADKRSASNGVSAVPGDAPVGDDD